jgi:hypothetical protein
MRFAEVSTSKTDGGYPLESSGWISGNFRQFSGRNETPKMLLDLCFSTTLSMKVTDFDNICRFFPRGTGYTCLPYHSTDCKRKQLTTFTSDTIIPTAGGVTSPQVLQIKNQTPCEVSKCVKNHEI